MQNEQERSQYEPTSSDDHVWLILLHMRQELRLVAYLLAADNVSRPLLCRLREVNQLVMSPQTKSAHMRFVHSRGDLVLVLNSHLLDCGRDLWVFI